MRKYTFDNTLYILYKYNFNYDISIYIYINKRSENFYHKYNKVINKYYEKNSNFKNPFLNIK